MTVISIDRKPMILKDKMNSLQKPGRQMFLRLILSLCAEKLRSHIVSQAVGMVISREESSYASSCVHQVQQALLRSPTTLAF